MIEKKISVKTFLLKVAAMFKALLILF